MEGFFWPLPIVARDIDMYDLDNTGVLTLPEFELYFKGIKNMAGDVFLHFALSTYMEVIASEYFSTAYQLERGGVAPLGRESSGPLALMTATPNVSESDAARQVEWDKKMQEIGGKCNRFESALLPEVVPPNKLGVNFNSIGALQPVKDTLHELCIFPLTHSQYFEKGLLKAGVKGVLLFGPPGTGKTMLAKAVAHEASATFINITPASIGGKYVGDREGYGRAIFTLARKLAPTIIFMDEIDVYLKSREGGEEDSSSSTMRSFMTALMVEWDGLTTPNDRVLVLGATNRPFDLDEAVLRRMPRRMYVDLPDAAARESILSCLLKDEAMDEEIVLRDIAQKTDGYSGSDLQNLCREAAYARVRELIKTEERGSPANTGDLRPISYADMLAAIEKCRPSTVVGAVIEKLKAFHQTLGDDGKSAEGAQRPDMYM